MCFCHSYFPSVICHMSQVLHLAKLLVFRMCTNLNFSVQINVQIDLDDEWKHLILIVYLVCLIDYISRQLHPN